MKKIFEVDWDSYEDLKEVFNKVKTRKLQLEPGRISKRQKQAIVYNSCFNILNTNISYLYADDNGINDYYVYAHCDTSNELKVKTSGTAAFAAYLGLHYYPFYIGKGRGNRAFDLSRNETHKKIRQKLKQFDKEIDVKIIESNLSNNNALALESKLIDIFGLLSKGGTLCNLDEGHSSSERIQIYIDDLKNINKFYHSF